MNADKWRVLQIVPAQWPVAYRWAALPPSNTFGNVYLSNTHADALAHATWQAARDGQAARDARAADLADLSEVTC